MRDETGITPLLQIEERVWQASSFHGDLAREYDFSKGQTGLGESHGHTKNRHTTKQPWSVSPVAPCSPGGQAGIDTKRKEVLTCILIRRASIPFSDCRSSHPRL